MNNPKKKMNLKNNKDKHIIVMIFFEMRKICIVQLSKMRGN